MNLIDTWRIWQAKETPYLLTEDRQYMLARNNAYVVRDWRRTIRAADFGKPGDSRFHLGLLPHPFCGDLLRASIYLLMLNPGLGSQDYFGEYEVPQYRREVLGTLKQRFSKSAVPFYFLDPRFAWHGSFGWWHGQFVRIIERLAEDREISFAEARRHLASSIASIELIPYHSVSFNNAGGLAKKLPSARLAQEFVHNYVVPRARAGEAIVIVARRAKAWNLPRFRNIVVYGPHEARGAHLGPGSSGGKRILEHLRALG